MAAIPDLSLILGPVQVGVAASSFLSGCLAIQAYVYYSKFTTDSCLFKIFVAFLVLLETTHLLCIVISQWQMTLGLPASLIVLPHAGDAVITLSGLIFFCVQSFFILRLLKLSKSKYLAVACLVLCAGFAISGEVIARNAFAMTSVERFTSTQYATIVACITAGVMCDIGVTAGLMYHLFKLRKAEFSRTTRTIDTLMLWTLETGLIPCVLTLASLTCFLTMGHNCKKIPWTRMMLNYTFIPVIWIGLYEILGSTYANACLAA
ncbi:hypothetical protein BJ138DRAFT_490193 [Hygrophoropsis aurantiaca]|uniref:Uncharacterized protein n=1 Tax=Hygrophoropsis aurantiaca TaxID=72124 RepID=A0ACB8ANE4_9AGAM|nr:hypothetical protein BJ138DRAFT_490193 [Hygrophoropsis aurantiaca]